jgi:CspA family cold shock protein
MCRGIIYIKPILLGKIKKMKKGTVKFFNTTKGFGFIKGEDGQEVFVHVTGLQEEIQENDVVSYDTEVGNRGVNAINVRLQH